MGMTERITQSNVCASLVIAATSAEGKLGVSWDLLGSKPSGEYSFCTVPLGPNSAVQPQSEYKGNRNVSSCVPKRMKVRERFGNPLPLLLSSCQTTVEEAEQSPGGGLPSF